MILNRYTYVISHFNILNSKKLKYKKILNTKKTLELIQVLHSQGVLASYTILPSTNKNISYIYFAAIYFKHLPFYSTLRLVSTASKKHYISLSALKLLTKSIGNSLVIMQTSKGLLSHKEALNLNLGGVVLCIAS
jgi:ribosomal protein S8